MESVPLIYFSTPWRGVYTRRWTYSIENIDRSAEPNLLAPTCAHRFQVRFGEDPFLNQTELAAAIAR